MLELTEIKIDGQTNLPWIDHQHPVFSCIAKSDEQGTTIQRCVYKIGDWEKEGRYGETVVYDGTSFSSFSQVNLDVQLWDSFGNTVRSSAAFRIGRMDVPWTADWITDRSLKKIKGVSPQPLQFRTRLTLSKPLRRAIATTTALGIYEWQINGHRVGEAYFKPGFTSYYHHIPYQIEDVTALFPTNESIIDATVGAGWASGRFNYTKSAHIRADRPAFRMELYLEFEDDTVRWVKTDSNWLVSKEGRYRIADWYDGEEYDAQVDLDTIRYRSVDPTKPRKHPRLVLQSAPPVLAHETFAPVSMHLAKSGEIVYDFGQNFAGVIRATIRSEQQRTVVFRHAEVLYQDELFVKSLRTAKATAICHCGSGVTEYSPRLTYMGFRYVGVSGIDPEHLTLTAVALYTDLEQTGSFECSNTMLNRLYQNIVWSGKSNFVEIPTDCPQRDERQGWTGDLAMFAKAGAFLFDTGRFYGKWLMDLNAEQSKGGGIPMVVPSHGDKWPVMATAGWGDACILVPWAEYLARGDLGLLKRQYPVMKRFLRAAKWWAGLFSITKTKRRIWRFPFHFGDWTAPDVGIKEWLYRGRWVATAYWANSCQIVETIATILGETKDINTFRKLRSEIVEAYKKEFTDGKGRLHHEFQTGYVLPLRFGMTEGAETTAMAAHLSELVRNGGHKILTGFTGTPHILYALSDHGYLEDAYKLLLQEACPSWLYAVKSGGTTMWERWDALKEDGTINVEDLKGDGNPEQSSGGMVSFNHYANGAVLSWLIERLVGLECLEPGYRSFTVKPLPGGDITHASASFQSSFGLIEVRWERIDDTLMLDVNVPVSTSCIATLPNGSSVRLGSGRHRLEEPFRQERS